MSGFGVVKAKLNVTELVESGLDLSIVIDLSIVTQIVFEKPKRYFVWILQRKDAFLSRHFWWGQSKRLCTYM